MTELEKFIAKVNARITLLEAEISFINKVIAGILLSLATIVVLLYYLGGKANGI